MPVSVNEAALPHVEELSVRADELGVLVEDVGGATLIDAGLNARGGYQAGLIITRICLGGLGDAELTAMKIGEVTLPAIAVSTDQPAVATLASQLAGWRINVGGFRAIGSGPARALALKPKRVYEEIGYRDAADVAVIVLEADTKPSVDALSFISERCGVDMENLYAILVPTNSVAGLVQISGRVVETGVHKLEGLGLNPTRILHGFGVAPIAPLHRSSEVCMGRSNDAILYGGITHYTIEGEDEELMKLAAKAPSSTSKDYGRPFHQIYQEAGKDFYKIDPGLFAPAQISITNPETGSVYTSGGVNEEILLRSFGIKAV